LRIWIEQGENSEADPVWRGVIRDVRTRDCTYFTKIDGIEEFFRSFLEDKGIKADKV
jgi:hypothetical protein